jgi:galactokinase
MHVHSSRFDETVRFSLDELAGAPRKHWSDYVRGVAATLQTAGCKLPGTNLIIDGSVPIGAGLSSSASVEIATAFALIATAQQDLPSLELVTLCQRAEHEYAGAQCGIMDQFVVTFGRTGNALMLDCRSLNYKLLPVPRGASLVICNTMVKHELAAGEYNHRRSQCEMGVASLRKHRSEIIALRDVTFPELEEYKNEFSETVYRRCRHVISENARVLAAAEALQAHDLSRFGRLMNDSHRSLRDDYEVSCRELDLLVELALSLDGVYGARMTGAGFGGCTVNLVDSDAVIDFEQRIKEAYEKATGIVPEVYVCSPAPGACEVMIDEN